MHALTAQHVAARRVARNHLHERAARDRVVDVVRDICGVQAQVTSAAELALAARVDGVTHDDVRAELWERRTLVKTWGPRGTLHLHPASDLPLWTAALRLRPSGLEPAREAALVAAIGDALDGRCLLRHELAAEVVARVGEWAREGMESGWGELIGVGVRAGRACFGPPRDNKVTFVRPDQWLGHWDEPEPPDAFREIVGRYLHAYAPVRVREIGRWLGVDEKPVDAALAALGAEEVRVGDRRRAWQLSGDTAPAGPLRGVRLLPKYDAYVLGSYPRETVVPKHVSDRLRAHPRGRFEVAAGHWTLLVDGVVAGMWERREGPDGVEVRVEPFLDLTRPQLDELEREAHRVGEFVGTDARLAIGALA